MISWNSQSLLACVTRDKILLFCQSRSDKPSCICKWTLFFEYQLTYTLDVLQTITLLICCYRAEIHFGDMAQKICFLSNGSIVLTSNHQLFYFDNWLLKDNITCNACSILKCNLILCRLSQFKCSPNLPQYSSTIHKCIS
jgi:hypothetical protein